jgi:lipoprotein-anchoring transpeptidase ErfK/SrfK
VDRDHQTLVAYEGDTPVFTTLVATGKVKWATPTGIYRVHGKDEKARMQDPGGLEDEWNVADVPYSMRFRKNFALHGTYWHDGFGRRRSHGCVNLSTSDAKRLYDWVTPEAPPGWTQAENLDGTGTPVRIHSSYDPKPKWLDYEGRPIKSIATK